MVSRSYTSCNGRINRTIQFSWIFDQGGPTVRNCEETEDEEVFDGKLKKQIREERYDKE